MERNIELLNTLYQNVEMGIVGIDDVIYKIRHPKLKKELTNERSFYEKYMKEIKKMLKHEHGTSKSIGLMAKISSNLYSEMKLMGHESDKEIIKMMIEGSYKSIGILTTKMMEYDTVSSNVMKMLKKLMDGINDNIANLKKLDKIC